MKKIVCRSAFCPACYAAGRPQKDDEFVLYKGTSGKTISQITGERTVWGDVIQKGYTPHLFSFIDEEDGVVHFLESCLMDGCDVEIQDDTNPVTGEVSTVTEVTNTNFGVMPISDWNALINRWRGYTGFEI